MLDDKYFTTQSTLDAKPGQSTFAEQCSKGEGALVVALVSMTRHIDDYRTGENQHIIFAFHNLHAVRIRQRNPLFRYVRDVFALSRESIVMFHEVSSRFEIVRPRNVYTEAATKEGEQLLLDRGIEFAFSVNLVGRTPGEQFLLDERLLPYRPRKVHARATKELMQAVVKNPEKDRLLRASAQYFHALQEWGPGQEIMALAHIYIGMEILTPVALRTHLSQYRIDKADLVSAWKIDLRRLDSEVRRRLVFDGDDDTYAKVKQASDGFEHGFLDFHDIRATALDLREKAAGYLRRALLRLSGLSQAAVSELSEHPYTRPFDLEYTKYLWGTLRGSGDILAADGQDFPIMMWRSKPSQKPNTIGPDPEIVFSETITARLAPGIEFQGRRLEVWGPQPDQEYEKTPLESGA